MIQQENHSLPKTGKSDVILDILVGSKEINHLAQKHPEERYPKKKIERLIVVKQNTSSMEISFLANKAIKLLEKKAANTIIKPEEGVRIYKEICESKTPKLIFT